MARVSDPNTARVALARFISHAGGVAAFFVGIWGKAAYEFHATAPEQALIMGSLGVFSLVGAAAAGVLIDRYDARRVLLVAELGFVPSTLALIFPETVLQMTAVVAASAIFSAAVMTAVSSFPPFLTDDPDRLQRINSTVEAAASSSFIAGPAIGALIYRWSGDVDWVFVFDALTSLIAVAIVFRVQLRARPAKEQRGRAVKEMKDGFAFVYRSQSLRLFILVGGVMWLVFGAFGALEPLFFRDVVGTSPEALGWVNTVFGLGMISGSYALNRIPARALCARVLIACMVGTSVGIFFYTGTARISVVVFGVAVLGVVLGLMFPMLRTLIQRDTPDALVGRVMGATHLHHQVGELLPLTFVPALAAIFGVQQVLVASGVVLAIAAALAYVEAGKVDRARGAPPVELLPLAVEEDVPTVA